MQFEETTQAIYPYLVSYLEKKDDNVTYTAS